LKQSCRSLSQDTIPETVRRQNSLCLDQHSNLVKGKGKGKIHPTTGHEGPEGEQRYRSTPYLTSVLDGGGWSTPRPGRSTPGKDPVTII